MYAHHGCVAALDTGLEPLQLLDALQKIELEQGRVRKDERWGPRTLDLDILLFGERLIDEPRLRVPHYHMQARAFVQRYLEAAPATPEVLLLGHNIEVALKDTEAAAGFRERLAKEFPESEQARRAQAMADRNPG